MAMTTGDNNTAADGALESLLGECVRQDASDLHLVPDLPPYLRSGGPASSRRPIARRSRPPTQKPSPCGCRPV